MADVCIAATDANVTVKEISKVVKTQSETTICGWAPPTFGDSGESGLHAALSVVAFAVAVWSAFEQMRVFNMRYQLAEGYADLAQEAWDRFDARYKPLEARMAAECMAEEPVRADYPAARSRDEGLSDFGFGQGRLELERSAALDKPCLGASRLRELELAGMAGKCDLVNLGFRDEESMARTMDDMRFNRRSNLLNAGRELASQSASYGRMAGQILSGAAGALRNTTAGAMSLVGYLRNRADTSYPAWLSQNHAPGLILGGAPATAPSSTME
jgi:hypothetical protein